MTQPLSAVAQALESIAPIALAEDWDNVGVLVECPDAEITRALLTIDLTEPVLDEAIDAGCQLIVAYHPPIFSGMKRLTLADAKQRIVLRAVRAGVSIYSPHTALDAVEGGVNDWLCDAFENATRRSIPDVAPGEVSIGRAVELAEPAALDSCVDRIKRHLGLEFVRVAAAAQHRDNIPIRTIALCAGAGGSVVQGEHADLYLTGEMRHHDVLAANERGTSVVLCDHTNTERGYLPTLRSRLANACPDIEFVIAARDEEPLRVV